MSLIDFLFPRTCHLCGRTLPPAPASAQHCLCAPCLAQLPRTLYHRSDNNAMVNRFAGLFPFERATAHFFYSAGSELSLLMQDLKYRRFRNLARYIGKTVGAELIPTGFLSDIDLIIPIPIHFLKKARRGYNQTEEIAAGLSAATGIPVDRSLRARRPHKTQTALTPDQRRRNLSDVFTLRANHGTAGKHILLLDDIYTTGSTLTEAACTIINISPSTRISILTVGVTF